jgi:hypothetical protein
MPLMNVVFPLDQSICWAAADADTQLAITDSSALEKQLPIFKFPIANR